MKIFAIKRFFDGENIFEFWNVNNPKPFDIYQYVHVITTWHVMTRMVISFICMVKQPPFGKANVMATKQAL